MNLIRQIPIQKHVIVCSINIIASLSKYDTRGNNNIERNCFYIGNINIVLYWREVLLFMHCIEYDIMTSEIRVMKIDTHMFQIT